jgi:hypothetical protein
VSSLEPRGGCTLQVVNWAQVSRNFADARAGNVAALVA